MHHMNQKLKQRELHRAKIIKGQMEGLIKGIETEVYCTELLMQSLSIQRSLKSLDNFMLENHLRSHVVEQIKSKDGQEKAVKELINIYTLAHKG